MTGKLSKEKIAKKSLTNKKSMTTLEDTITHQSLATPV